MSTDPKLVEKTAKLSKILHDLIGSDAQKAALSEYIDKERPVESALISYIQQNTMLLIGIAESMLELSDGKPTDKVNETINSVRKVMNAELLVVSSIYLAAREKIGFDPQDAADG